MPPVPGESLTETGRARFLEGLHSAKGALHKQSGGKIHIILIDDTNISRHYTKHKPTAYTASSPAPFQGYLAIIAEHW